LYFWLSILAAVLLDRLTKLWVLGHFQALDSYPLIDGLVSITLVRNYGAAFGVLSGQRWLFMGIAGLTLAGMTWFYFRYRPGRLMQLAVGCIGGGAAGNMIDRICYGSVVDFVSVGWWPVFNVADMAIVSGCAGLFLLVWREKEGDVE
jgi:signal peptidase II